MKNYEKILLVAIGCSLVVLAIVQTSDWGQSNCKMAGFGRSEGAGLKLQKLVCN
jgi:hypothetical protein